MTQFETLRTNGLSDSRTRTVLVTGGAGFIGAHLVRRLAEKWPRLNLRVLDALTYAADLARLSPLVDENRVAFIHGDVANASDARSAMAGVDVVFHLAAESHVPRSFADPGLFDRTNRLGTKTMLDAAIEAGVSRFIHASTDEVYGPAEQPVDEDAPLLPSTPYARSKADAEAEVRAARARGLDVRILRPTNAIGPGQHPEKLAPRFVSRILAGRTLTVEGKGEQQRTFLPVGDLVSAFVLAAGAPTANGVFNVSGLEEFSVLDLARLVGEATGIAPQLEFVADRQVNDFCYRLDDRRLRALGFRQVSSVREEIGLVVDEWRAKIAGLAPAPAPDIDDLVPVDPIGAPVSYHRPHRSIREADVVADVLARGRFAASGRYTAAAEKRLCELTGADHVFLTHSCTAAMEIAALALGLGPGDEVIVPTYTFCATATAFERTGARIVFADIDAKTMMIDPEDALRRITARTRAIVPVHYGGNLADMRRLNAIAAIHGIAVVEDAAQALGASLDGRPAGNLGPFAAFSFHETKIVHCGHGGALAVNGGSEAMLERIARILDRGTDFSESRREGRPFYQWTGAGSSFRPTEIQAAILSDQLLDLPAVIRHRRQIAALYAERLARLSPAFRLLDMRTGVAGNGHGVILIAETESFATRLRRHLKALGVEAQTHYVPLHLATAGQERGWRRRDCPNAEAIWRRLLRLPIHGEMSLDDAGRISDAVTRFASMPAQGIVVPGMAERELA